MYIFFGGISDKIFEGAKAWFFKKSEARASYDNLIDMSGTIAGFLGYLIALVYVPSLRMAIFFNFIATFFYCLGIIWYTIPCGIRMSLKIASSVTFLRDKGVIVRLDRTISS